MDKVELRGSSVAGTVHEVNEDAVVDCAVAAEIDGMVLTLVENGAEGGGKSIESYGLVPDGDIPVRVNADDECFDRGVG